MTEKTKVKVLEEVVVRFSGDSGDGMQLAGNIFSNVSAGMGDEISTFPDYPAEIRAPQGTLGGVSGFQVHIGRGVHTPGDLAGMKIRVMNSRTDMETIDALGASPTPISSGETYTSMAQGVVDGAENNIPTYYLSGHCEVAKYFTEDEHSSIPDVLVMSQKTWDSLSQEDRQIIMKAARESSKFQRQLWEKFVSEAREALAKKGVEFIVPDKSVFAEKIRKVYDSRKGTESGALVDEIRAVK